MEAERKTAKNRAKNFLFLRDLREFFEDFFLFILQAPFRFPYPFENVGEPVLFRKREIFCFHVEMG